MQTYKGLIPEITLKYKNSEEFKYKITSSKDGYDVFMKFYDQDVFDLTESLIVLFLNRANNTIGWIKHSQGGTTQTVCDPKLIIATALKCNASAIMVSHNHPSGELRPSREDERITTKLKDACNYFDITLLDHIIATKHSYYSFSDEGKL